MEIGTEKRLTLENGFFSSATAATAAAREETLREAETALMARTDCTEPRDRRWTWAEMPAAWAALAAQEAAARPDTGAEERAIC